MKAIVLSFKGAMVLYSRYGVLSTGFLWYAGGCPSCGKRARTFLSASFSSCAHNSASLRGVFSKRWGRPSSARRDCEKNPREGTKPVPHRMTSVEISMPPLRRTSRLSSSSISSLYISVPWASVSQKSVRFMRPPDASCQNILFFFSC